MYFRTGFLSYVFYVLVMVSLFVMEIRLSFSHTLQNKTMYLAIGRVIRARSSANVYHKGSIKYNKRRIVHNALCKTMFPDLVVVPKSTIDVSTIIKISRYYGVPLSVRSGGHSLSLRD